VSLPVFLTAFVAIPLVLSVLDLAERRRTRRQRGQEEPSPGALLLLFVVFLVYSMLQYGGFALVPRAETIAEQARAFFDRWSGRPPAGQPLHAPGGVVLVVPLVVSLFYLAGLWDYLLHRFVSHGRWLWFTHEYHHLPSQVFVLVPGISARPFAVVSTFPVVLATIVTACGLFSLFGLPVWNLAPLQALVLVQVFVLTASHSSCLRNWWWFHRVLKRLGITTPQEHVLHHAVDLRGNYGNFTTLWDRLFGTYLDPECHENQGHACGLPYDQDFLGAITLGALKIPEGLRHRLQVGRYCNLAPPGPPTSAGAEVHSAATATRPADHTPSSATPAGGRRPRARQWTTDQASGP
jgi:sterol desaturase/sphingolipid hydroxylase (fatty acid hydroxylase superfamily)